MKRVYLHIGMGKTGTKSIQAGLHSIRDRLAERGICYPQAPAGNHGPQVGSLFVDDPVSWSANARWKLSAAQVENANQTIRQALARDIESAPDFMILSGEGFFSFNRRAIERIVGWMRDIAEDYRVVVYFREPRGWAKSYIQQVMKRGTTLEELLNKRFPIPPIRDRLERWMSVCGRDHILVFDFGAARRHPFSIGGHFVEHIGFPEWSEAMSDFHNNASLNISVEALAEIRAEIKQRGTIIPSSQVRAIAAKYPNGTKIVIPDALLADVEKQTRPDLEWLESEFGLRLTP